MEYSAPQIARIWPSRCWRALSVRDIEDALMGAPYRQETAVSRFGGRLSEDYQAFARRALSEY